MSLEHLPTELYSAIIFHVPTTTLQQTVLSLTRALPRSPIPLRHLFHSVSIVHPDQAVRLNRRLRSGIPKQAEPNPSGDHSNPAHWVYRFSVETWQVDADVLINLVRLLPNLEYLNVWIGPSNFEPAHLEEMFSRYMPRLRHLSLRFRPYVQKATYLPFLKAAYFDTTLLALSAWPPSPQGLPTLSVVQDPNTAQVKQRFAQPIVFFRLDLHLSLLVHSPIASASLKSLRIRIPARPVVQPLTVAYQNPNTPSAGAATAALPPSIQILDLSTCYVTESDIDALLVRFTHLEHLILDECTPLLRAGSAMGQELDWWAALGRRCALTGVRKAREREKALKTWLEALSRNHFAEDEQLNGLAEPRRPRRGRRGLATATISLRPSTSPPRSLPSTSSRPAGAINQQRRSIPPKIHIVPPLPTLHSISLYPTSNITASPGTRARVLAEFENGWNDGLRVIWEKRGRMGTTFRRGTTVGVKPRFLKFKKDLGVSSGEVEEGFEDLEDVKSEDESIFFLSGDGNGTVTGLINAPVLCLAGPKESVDGHASGCSHSVAWSVWEDKL